jgi:RNA polymerase sigma-70 factor (ECF subfamily)
MEILSNEAASDVELVRAVRRGSVDALGQLYDRHAVSLFHTAYRFARSEADAQDVVQDVFVGLRHALSRYEEEGRFEAWVRRVTVRRALDVRREAHRAHEPLESLRAEVQPSPHPDPLDREALRRALAALPDTLRDVFLLREREGYSHQEIGEILGIRPGTSAVRLHRAHKRLRRLLR